MVGNDIFHKHFVIRNSSDPNDLWQDAKYGNQITKCYLGYKGKTNINKFVAWFMGLCDSPNEWSNIYSDKDVVR
jgi:hypothetical protein